MSYELATKVPHNPNCDGAHCRSVAGEVRVLPTGGDSNAILCRECWRHEMGWRRERNSNLEKSRFDLPVADFDLPEWETLEVYDAS